MLFLLPINKLINVITSKTIACICFIDIFGVMIKNENVFIYKEIMQTLIICFFYV